MKTNLVRSLCLFSFLLLMAPFYDRCNGKGFKERAAEAPVEESPIVPVDAIAKEDDIALDSIATNNNSVERSDFEKCYDYIDDPNSENAFEMAGAVKTIFTAPYEEVQQEIIDD